MKIHGLLLQIDAQLFVHNDLYLIFLVTSHSWRLRQTASIVSEDIIVQHLVYLTLLTNVRPDHTVHLGPHHRHPEITLLVKSAPQDITAQQEVKSVLTVLLAPITPQKV